MRSASCRPPALFRDVSRRCTPEDPPRTPLPGPAETVVWGGTLPSGRRAVLGGLSAAGIALGGNLGGITTALLSTQPERARALRLDALFPVGGLLRHVDGSEGFELLYPVSWLADQTIARRRAAALEAQSPLDPPSLARQERRRVGEPVVAFGPPGTSGEENLSVVVQEANAFGVTFRLKSLGSPEEVAVRLFEGALARPGSGKEATLLGAEELPSGAYALEFVVKSPAWERHFLSVLYGDRRGRLFTLTVQVPQATWPQREALLRPCAASFRVWES